MYLAQTCILQLRVRHKKDHYSSIYHPPGDAHKSTTAFDDCAEEEEVRDASGTAHLQEVVLLVDLNKLEGCTGSEALLSRQFVPLYIVNDEMLNFGVARTSFGTIK